ncbi:MAG: ABC transporter ATP-binding protein, partial [Proteobacteria bacterium]|nr:ABC transporter ATP-binding protein [Pseudomonadota bacterium]
FSDYEKFERRNRTDIANRFFEITNIQKVFPDILFGGFSIIQQVIVGFLLISFYHVSFLAFSLLIIFLSYLIVRIKGLNSLNHLYRTSNNKYDVIDLLENISRMHKEFRSKHSIEYAKNKVNKGVTNFLDNNDRYFSELFSQSISFLALYIFSSCGFLLIGSILVLEGEITIGQLVAMELVVSTSLLRLSEFGKYLDNFYELCVACGKINIFYNIDHEKDSGDVIASDVKRGDDIISMRDVQINYQNKTFNLDFDIKTSSSNLIAVDSNNSRDIFCKLVLKFIEPESGEIKYHNHNIENIDPYSLRDKVYIIDSSEIYQCSILEYLTDGVDVSKAEIQKALNVVKIDKILKDLNIDLNSTIIPCGYPFSPTQIIRLKIAKALLYNPEIIILGTIFDRIEYSKKQHILRSIREFYPESTLIHFTNINIRDYDFEYDRYFFIGLSSIKSFKTLKEFIDFEYQFFIKKINEV